MLKDRRVNRAHGIRGRALAGATYVFCAPWQLCHCDAISFDRASAITPDASLSRRWIGVRS